MSSLPLPAPYHSSEDVFNAISLAYSTLNNPRGLEIMWNAPYSQSIRELANNYPGHFVLFSPYTMWLPETVRQETTLRNEFATLGEDYDLQPDETDNEENSVPVSNDDSGNADENPIEEVAPATSSGVVASEGIKRPKSSRIPILKKLKEQNEGKKRESLLKLLQKQRRRVISAQNIALNAAVRDGDTSVDSAFSIHGSVIDKIPDIYLSHTATTAIQSDKHGPGSKHYIRRAGRKVYHHCGSIVVELKSPPSRLLNDAKFTASLILQLREAQNDLMEYCAAYFECFPDAESIVVIAAAGPFWKWAHVRPDNVPVWDWQRNEPKLDSRKKANFMNNFPVQALALGTETSDNELTKILKHMHALLAHTPPAPVQP